VLIISTTEKYPAELRVSISKEMQTDLNNMATKRNVPVAELVRTLLSESLSEESASNGQTAIRQAVRAEMKLLLKPIENRLAKLGARASIAAGTTENMVVTLFERSIPGDTSEKQRQAKEIHNDARKKAVSGLKQSGGEEEDA
jgi:predicted DNA-binding ribbon-helix-helix protein